MDRDSSYCDWNCDVNALNLLVASFIFLSPSFLLYIYKSPFQTFSFLVQFLHFMCYFSSNHFRQKYKKVKQQQKPSCLISSQNNVIEEIHLYLFFMAFNMLIFNISNLAVLLYITVIIKE
jgi:hypothetical protein